MKTRNIEAKQYFSKKAAQYYQEHYQDITSKTSYPALYLRHQYILEMVPEQKRGRNRALDIGCGSGVMVRDLLTRGYAVVAADISREMLKATRKTVAGHPRATRVKYTQQDIEKMRLPNNAFDLIICSGVIEYLKEDDNALREIARVLKRGGVAFISIQNKVALPRALIEFLFLVVPTSWKDRIVTVKQHRCHVPWTLDKKLKQLGLKKAGFAYFHFYPFFIPFDHVFPRFSVWAGKKMERWSKSKLGWLGATGYVVKVRKV